LRFYQLAAFCSLTYFRFFSSFRVGLGGGLGSEGEELWRLEESEEAEKKEAGTKKAAS